MAFKMKGSSLYGKINLNRGGQASKPDGRAKSSAFQVAGAFVDGERTTYDAARKAESEGGNVTYTNREQRRRNEEDLKSEDKQTRENAEQYAAMKPYKGEKGKEKEFEKAKKDDAKAQKSTEYRAKIKSGEISKSEAGFNRDSEGYLQNRHGQGQKAFDKRNKNIKTKTDKEGVQVVKGAEKTINTPGANPKGYNVGSKNVDDYKKEKSDKRTAELKAKAGIKTKPGAPAIWPFKKKTPGGAELVKTKKKKGKETWSQETRDWHANYEKEQNEKKQAEKNSKKKKVKTKKKKNWKVNIGDTSIGNASNPDLQ
jgi:hypothetical protein